MATSSKFDMSSGSPDRPLYVSGQRGSHLASQLDRSGSFRESMENPMLASFPNMVRSSSVIPPGEIVNFFQCLRFDPKVVAADHKSSRQVDFKRHIDVALGISVDDSGVLKGKMSTSCMPEEIKRVKVGLRDGSVKARERVKIFNEALSVLNKFFPSVPSKKRSRLEGFSGDRPGGLLSNDRPMMSPGLGKMSIHNHAISSSVDFEQQKLGERPRNAIPNKRTRTSSVDVRSNAQAKPSGLVDRDREMPRYVNTGTVQAEDRTTLSVGVDGWEKTKMKKKRSGIKPDVSTSVASMKPTDSYREPKPGIQQRPVADSRSRLTSDSHGFSRLGIANGAVGPGKPDDTAQPTGLSIRSSIPRADLDNSPVLNDKKERPAGSDKDRFNLKAANKANVCDEFNSASPTSRTKMNAAVQAPRSSTCIAPKLSPVVHRATASNDWELPPCANKPAALGADNCKRTASTRSSSPPVAHWTGQRPQKISRTARRTSLIPIVSSNDETAALDPLADVSAAFSESEESGAPEIKSKEKGERAEEADEKVGQNVQKLSTLGMPSRKNKLVTGEDLGDGVRRQGRTGRGFASSRSLVPVSVEKLGNVGTAKQLRSARHGFDKTERLGRPPTRKLSDRKAYAHQKHAVVNVSADFLVGSDDGNEELLAAANAVINPGHAVFGSFWRKMEPFFGFIFDDDFALLKQRGNLELPSLFPSDVNDCRMVPNEYGSVKDEGEAGHPIETSSFEIPQKLASGVRYIPLFQRLLTALIPEDNSIQGSGDVKFDAYGTGIELDEELGSNGLNDLNNFQFSGSAFNGYKPTAKHENNEVEIGVLEIPTMGVNSNFSPLANGFLSDQTRIPGMAYAEFPYSDLKIDEKLQLEVHGIGIVIEPSPMQQMEDARIFEEIGNLKEKFQGQALKKKVLLDKLLKSASEAKELQEKEFERRAHDKLVTMAYEKYMACRGSLASGGKSTSNKMAKQSALAFVKRTLEQCHRFEGTGKSWFNEPLFREMFLTRSSNQSRAGLETPMDGESTKLYPYSSSRSFEARGTAATMGSHSRLGQNGDNNFASSPDVLPHVSNYLPEQDTSKEDIWSNRMKKRELLLDDVGGGMVGNSPSGPAGIGGSLSSSTKGKRSERDREGKGHNREAGYRSGTNKIGRAALANAKGERKSKTKPKQKTAQLSVSVNGLVGKIPEHPKPALPSEPMSSGVVANSNAKEKELGLDVLDDPEAIVFSNLLGMDDYGQGNDLGAWLNIDDEGLQDHDFMGLEIPMDDLSDLNMMV